MTPEDLTQCYQNIFECNKEGQAIFDDLVKRFGKLPSQSNGLDRVIDQFEYGGRRQVIEYIVMKINQANGVNDYADTEVSIDG